MAKYKFVGDPRYDGEGPDVISCHGMTFPKGIAVDVEDAAIVAKLDANSHFELAKAAGPGRPRKVANDASNDEAVK